MSDTLDDLQHRIADLSSLDGEFYVACPDTGERPVPLKGTSFASAADAERAVDLARTYRERLRGISPTLPERRIVAYEKCAGPLSSDTTRKSDGGGKVVGNQDDEPRTSQSVTLTGNGDGEWLRMDDAPLVDVRRDGELVDDAVVEYQLSVEL